MIKRKIKDPELLFYKGAITGDNAGNFVFNIEKLQRAVNALASNESSCIIYGERGVGKTSFAWQIFSILNDTNSKYKKKDLLVIGKEKKFKTIFFKCNNQIENIYELLLNLMKPSPDGYSLSKVFPELYEDKKFKTKFKSQFKFDLYGLINVQLGLEQESVKAKVNENEMYKILSTSQTILSLFEAVTFEIKELHPNNEIIIFIDEIDAIKDRTGLGGLLKNINHCKFVFIGIANSVSEIILDHQSAGRKLIGGDIEIENLNDDQISWIFKNAEKRSNEGVSFSDEFFANAVRYSGGFPWIAQNLGFHSILLKLYKGVNEDDPIIIDFKLFELALKEVTKLYQKELESNLDFEFAVDSTVKIKILDFIWSSKFSATDEQIRNAAGEMGRLVPTSLLRLQESGVLVKTVNSTYRYKTPIIRIFIRYLIDKMREA